MKLALKIFDIRIQIRFRFRSAISMNTHLRPKIFPSTLNLILIEFDKPKQIYNIYLLRESTLLDIKKDGGQMTKPSGHQPTTASSVQQPTASSDHQPAASSGHQPKASSGQQPTASNGLQPATSSCQMGAPISINIKGQQAGFQSISKSGNKAKMIASGSTKVTNLV